MYKWLSKPPNLFINLWPLLTFERNVLNYTEAIFYVPEIIGACISTEFCSASWQCISSVTYGTKICFLSTNAKRIYMEKHIVCKLIDFEADLLIENIKGIDAYPKKVF